jgi:hypothetical protein
MAIPGHESKGTPLIIRRAIYRRQNQESLANGRRDIQTAETSGAEKTETNTRFCPTKPGSPRKNLNNRDCGSVENGFEPSKLSEK